MKKLVLFILLFSNLAYGSNKNFDQALASYEKLHQSFFDNNLDSIKKNSTMLLKSIESIKDEKISKTLTYTKKKLGEISKSDNLENSKQAFDVVSRGLLVVLAKQAPNKSYAKYYCPMVKKYWIQNITESEKVMNPYASSSMPHCGSKE
jgi:hypothetical protein